MMSGDGDHAGDHAGEHAGDGDITPVSTGDPFADAVTAAAHMPMTAQTLADGIVTAADIEGDPDSDAATLHADLAANLQEHVYLAGVAVFTAYTSEGGTDSEQFAAAAETLDHNSVALADAVGSVAGDDKGEQFLELWREHIGYFVDYAEAVATGDGDAADTALENLDGYRPQAGEFFAEITDGELDADEIATGLAEHISTVAGTIDSLDGTLND